MENSLSCSFSTFNLYRLSIPYPKWWRPEVYQNSDFFFFIIIWEYLYIHDEIVWGWDSSLNTKFMCLLYPCIHSLKVIFLIILHMKQSFHCDLSYEVRWGIFHLWRHIDIQKVSNTRFSYLGMLDLCFPLKIPCSKCRDYSLQSTRVQLNVWKYKHNLKSWAHFSQITWMPFLFPL